MPVNVLKTNRSRTKHRNFSRIGVFISLCSSSVVRWRCFLNAFSGENEANGLYWIVPCAIAVLVIVFNMMMWFSMVMPENPFSTRKKLSYFSMNA